MHLYHCAVSQKILFLVRERSRFPKYNKTPNNFSDMLIESTTYHYNIVNTLRSDAYGQTFKYNTYNTYTLSFSSYHSFCWNV